MSSRCNYFHQLNGAPISKMLVDRGAIVNLMPYCTFKKLGRFDDELIKTNMMLNGIKGGEPIGGKGVASMELNGIQCLTCLDIS